MKTYLSIPLIILMVFSFASCSQKKEGDEPTKYVSQDGLEQLTKQAAEKSTEVKLAVKNNPGFSSFREIQPSSDALKNLDAVIRPVLVRQFGGAKIIEQNNEPISEAEGDMTLNSMQYVVKGMMNEENAEELHAALKEARFSPNVRLGTKPTITRNWAMMTFFAYSSGVTYSILFKIDFNKQIIILKNYQLGSKYERLL
jgi:hypothetical protein